jgi:RNA-binding protein 25
MTGKSLQERVDEYKSLGLDAKGAIAAAREDIERERQEKEKERERQEKEKERERQEKEKERERQFELEKLRLTQQHQGPL